jgi:hypothetical protein
MIPSQLQVHCSQSRGQLPLNSLVPRIREYFNAHQAEFAANPRFAGLIGRHHVQSSGSITSYYVVVVHFNFTLISVGI